MNLKRDSVPERQQPRPSHNDQSPIQNNSHVLKDKANNNSNNIIKSANYNRYDAQLKKYNDILANNKHNKLNKNQEKSAGPVNDYIKIYGVGLGQQERTNSLSRPSYNNSGANKQSKNSMKIKLDPIKGSGINAGSGININLPKLIHGSGK